MHPTIVLAAALSLAGTFALAQQSADPVIAARQQVMKTVGASMKVLGEMASGKAAFDAGQARAATAALTDAAAKVPATFDQKALAADSKASPRIWEDHAGFLKHAADLKAGAAAIEPSSLDSLKASLGAAGGTCRACHTDYRL